MQLRDTRLLLVILGLPTNSSNLQQRGPSAALGLNSSLYSRATSSEGLLSIRKYWDSHCSTFSKLPALALVNPSSSCPRGLSPALFLELLSRLTDLQEWQIWDLWSSLDVHACGFVGCAEFTLLVVLLCAGVAQQQLQAVHAYASSICRVFAGAHVGGGSSSTCMGLCQCCQLMGLPVSMALISQQLTQLTAATNSTTGSSTTCGSSSSQLAGKAGGCSTSSGRSSSGRRSSSHSIQPASQPSSSSRSLPPPHTCSAEQRVLQESAAAAVPAVAPAEGSLGCCCSRRAGGGAAGGWLDGQPNDQQVQQQQQWACGAAAHRQHSAAAVLQGAQKQAVQAAQVQLALFAVAERHTQRQLQHKEAALLRHQEEEQLGWMCGCRMC